MQDKETILQTVLDYIEGWYYSDPARMERALYVQLVKRRITPEGEVWQVDKPWMIEATGKGKGKIENPETGRKEITILHQTERMASVMLVSEAFVDYLHLVKDAGKWVIVNALWDYHD